MNIKKVLKILTIVTIILQFSMPIHAEPTIPSRIIVEECIIKNGGLSPNSVSTVSFAIKNTSSTQIAYSILITAGWKNTQSSPTEFINTNQVYIDEIEPGNTVMAEFEVRTKAVELVSIKSIPCNLIISFYNINEAMQSGVEISSNDVTVQIPILENTRDYEAYEGFTQNTVIRNNLLDFSFSSKQIVYIIGFIISLFTLAGILLIKYVKKSD